MKRRFVKEIAVLGILAVFSRDLPAYAGWYQQDHTWRYRQEKDWVKEDWVYEEGNWYYLDKDGVMASGWRKIGGFWYFFNPISDGSRGRMMTGWQWIDGRCYYLAETGGETCPKGAMYADGRTPDGYLVDKSGAWTDAEGNVADIPGKGILTDSREKTTGVIRSGGVGGSGSSGGGGSSSRGSSGAGGSGSRGSGSSGSQGSKSSGAGDSGSQKSGNGGVGSRDESSGGDSRNHDSGRNGAGNDKNRESEETGKSEKDSTEGKTHITATDSNVRLVNWYVHFVDEDTHQTRLAETRKGSIQDGERLMVNFPRRIADQDRGIWESVEEPPLTFDVYGPGQSIFYVEYRLTGKQEEKEDFSDERERLQEWISLAKEQEAVLTGEEIAKIPDSRIVVSDQKGNDGRLLTAAGQIPAFQEYAVYVIGKNQEPDGVILKNVCGEEIVYSQMEEDRLVLEKDVYVITRFSLKKEVRQENCSHRWEEVKEYEAGCTERGRRIFLCEKCRAEKSVFLIPPGHKDEDQDQICDRCGEKFSEEAKGRFHWEIGDVLVGEIDGECFSFRCIDQNYSDQTGNHRQGALFLCDSVIPADFGSSWSYGLQKDGSYGYIFCPGPVVNFGDSNDYKYSDIRAWLLRAEKNFPDAENIDVGVSVAYAGATGQGMYGQLWESDLKGSYIGNQKLTGKLFILSVDEALKYRDWLWRFEGSEEENPDSQTGAFSKGYWLRNPMGTVWENDTGYVYGVDLENGMIRPVGIKPAEESEDEELRFTCAIGVRPAFVMPQK